MPAKCLCQSQIAPHAMREKTSLHGSVRQMPAGKTSLQERRTCSRAALSAMYAAMRCSSAACCAASAALRSSSEAFAAATYAILSSTRPPLSDILVADGKCSGLPGLDGASSGMCRHEVACVII